VNVSNPPSIEVIQAPSSAQQGPAKSPRRRWTLFFGVLLLSVAVSAAWVYSRSPVFRASASVLTVKPADVDERSAEADTEHVAIQARLLQSDALLERVGERLAEQGGLPVGRSLRSMVSIVPVPETNLLELRAEGAEPAELQRVANTWAETYESFRAEEVEAATGRTTAEVEEQQAELAKLISAARDELQTFREAKDIVDLDRSENTSPAQLRGINESLAKARERLVEAQAREAAVRSALGKGETVVPNEQKADIARQKVAVERARAQLTDLRTQYTDEYLERDPMLRSLPEQVRLMEGELARTLQLAGATVLDETRQEVEAAKLGLTSIERQLKVREQAVQEFNENYKQFRLLEDNLQRYETLYSDNEERLAQIQAQGFRKYPQIQVVEWARLPREPIAPDYKRDMLIASGISLALALFVTWLFEYLAGSAQPRQPVPHVGIRIQPIQQVESATSPGIGHLKGPRGGASAALTGPSTALPRILSDDEVHALLNECGQSVAAHAVLLLSGVSPYELPLLDTDALDVQAGIVHVTTGGMARDIPVDPAVWPLLAGITQRSVRDEPLLPIAELNSRLARAALDANLAQPGSVDALSLWYSYAAFLARQGVPIEDLEANVGVIPAAQRYALAELAPEHGQDRIIYTHPALGG
jgi:succinoglycan biosynthesis transport protein ExoP